MPVLNSIQLKSFRNHTNKKFEFSPSITTIIGPNGSGKTNILEAIYLLSHAKSPRAEYEQDMINISSGFTHIIGNLDNGDKLESIINRKENSNRVEKVFLYNKVKKNVVSFIGNFTTVFFAPEHIRLVAGSPSRRRDYVDKLLSQVDINYRKNLYKYNKVLKQRNSLLDQIKGQYIQNIHENQLTFWNNQLLETGVYLQKKRKEFFEYSEQNLEKISSSLFAEEGYSLKLNYLPSNLSKERLDQVKPRELIYGTTQIGPHRDDFEFILINSKSLNLKQYGSRGQQRTGVLCLKILEMKYIEQTTKEKPILLLDDIFSELDNEYRKVVQTAIQNYQTIITTADIDSVPKEILETSKKIQL